MTSLFVAVLHPKLDGLEHEARLQLICERVKDAPRVHVECFEPFPPMPIVNDVGYTSLHLAVVSGASHLVFLASDFIPCDGFVEVVTKAIEARPNEIISLRAQAGAQFIDPGWYTSADGVPAAFVMPMPMVSEYLAFADEAINEFGHSATIDMNVCLYAQYMGLPIYHTVPSLVETGDDAIQPFDSKERWKEVDWTGEVQVFIGRESASAHWRLIGALKPEYRQVRRAYELERVQPQLSVKLQARVEARNTPKEFVAPDSMMPFIRQVVAGEYDFAGMPDLKAPVVLDLGANLGAFALWAKRRFDSPEIHCYEPHPDNLKILKHNVETFEIPALIHGVAVATSTETTVKLHDGLYNCGEASIHNMFGKDNETPVHEVSVVSPELLIAADVMKLDTEGCEWDILSHYQHFDRLRAIMLEWHSAPDKERITEFLLSHGYQLTKEVDLSEQRGVLCFAK